MYLQHEINGKLQLMSADEIQSLKKELLDTDQVESLSEEQLTKDLANYYQTAHTLEMQSMGMVTTQLFGINIPDILKRIKKFICSKVGAGSSRDEIVDAIIEALAGIIPGGVIIKALAKKLVKYILDKGIDTFCGL